MLLKIASKRKAPEAAAALHEKALVYMGAARHWADLAIDAVRDIHGEDSPAFQVWSEARSGGVWDEGGVLNFYQRWIDAGLSAPLEEQPGTARAFVRSGA